MSRARTIAEIRSIARSHTRTAINVLVGIMRSKDATPAARVSAANAVLDRGWGKVAQQPEGGDSALALSYTFKAVITIIISGVVGALWLGVRMMLAK